MPVPTQTIEGTIQSLRIFHLALLLSVGLYIHALRIIPTPAPRIIHPVVLLGMGFCSLAALALAIFFRRKKLQPAFETLRTNPDDARSLQSWRAASILSAVLAEGVVLNGFGIYMMGAGVRHSAVFFAGGTAAILAWWPRRP